jgi:hypothetical protein
VRGFGDARGLSPGLFALLACALLLPACGEKVGMRGRCRSAQTRCQTPSPGLLAQSDLSPHSGERKRSPGRPNTPTEVTFSLSALAWRGWGKGVGVRGFGDARGPSPGLLDLLACALLLPACGEKVGMRGRCRSAQTRCQAPSPGLLMQSDLSPLAGRGKYISFWLVTTSHRAAAQTPLRP